jgi:hypothetical protein
MILKVHVDGATCHEIGDEIWQETLEDAIRSEAELIAQSAADAMLDTPRRQCRGGLVDRIASEMAAALTKVGDSYRAPDGVEYSLVDSGGDDQVKREDKLSSMNSGPAEPIVVEVLRFENLPLKDAGRRHAVVRWSDGTESPALAWYPDEILICEGDLIGKTRTELRSLHFRRDRDWLQS